MITEPTSWKHNWIIANGEIAAIEFGKESCIHAENPFKWMIGKTINEVRVLIKLMGNIIITTP